jgi:hypothetical protein
MTARAQITKSVVTATGEVPPMKATLMSSNDVLRTIKQRKPACHDL